MNDQIPSGGQARTFSAWIKPECHDEYGNIFGYGDPDATTPAGFALGVKCAPPQEGGVMDLPYANHMYSTRYGNDAMGSGHSRGRLDSPQGWSAQHNDQNQWFQMTIPNGEAWVTGVVTISRVGGQRVETFKVSYRDENDNWQFLMCGGSHCVLTGNNQNDVRRTTTFAEPVWTSTIRIHPWTWSGHVSMRAGLLVSPGLDGEQLGLKVQQPTLVSDGGQCSGVTDWDTVRNEYGAVVTCVEGVAYALYDTDADRNNGFTVSNLEDLRGRCAAMGLEPVEIQSAAQVHNILRPLVQDQCNGWQDGAPAGGCDGEHRPGYDTNIGRGIPLGFFSDSFGTYRSLADEQVDVAPIMTQMHQSFNYNGDYGHRGMVGSGNSELAGFGWGRGNNDPGIEDFSFGSELAAIICSDNGPPPPVDNSTIWLPGLAVDYQWTHVVLTVEEDNMLTVYINGDLVGQFADLVGVALDTAPVTEDLPFVIGAGAWIDFPYEQRWDFNGLIHSVKVWNRALTAQEVFLDQDTCIITSLDTIQPELSAPQCTGSDDGTGDAAAATPGAPCALNADATGCAVEGGDCAFSIVPAAEQTAYTDGSLVAYYVMDNSGSVIDRTGNTLDLVDNTWLVGGSGARNATAQECPCAHADAESGDCLHLVEPPVTIVPVDSSNVVITECGTRSLDCNNLQFNSGGWPMPSQDDSVKIVNSAIPSGPDARTFSAWIKVDCNNIQGYGGSIFSYGRAGASNDNPVPGRGSSRAMVFNLMVRPQCVPPENYPGGMGSLEQGGNINLDLHSNTEESIGWTSIGNFDKSVVDGEWTHIAVTVGSTGDAASRFTFCVNGQCANFADCPLPNSAYGHGGCNENQNYLNDMNTWPVTEEYPFVIGSGAYGEGGGFGSGGLGIGEQGDFPQTETPGSGCGNDRDCFDFAGSIQNFKIWNRRLEYEEVMLDFKTCVPVIGAGMWGSSLIGSYGLNPTGVVINAVPTAINETILVGRVGGRSMPRGNLSIHAPPSCNEYVGVPGYDGVNGIYPIRDQVGEIRMVYCDMTTDGGGWTKIAHDYKPDGSLPDFATEYSTGTPENMEADYWGGARMDGDYLYKSVVKYDGNPCSPASACMFISHQEVRFTEQADVVETGSTDSEGLVTLGGYNVRRSDNNNLNYIHQKNGRGGFCTGAPGYHGDDGTCYNTMFDINWWPTLPGWGGDGRGRDSPGGPWPGRGCCGGGHLGRNELFVRSIDREDFDPNAGPPPPDLPCEFSETVVVDAAGYLSNIVQPFPAGCCEAEGCSMLLDEVGEFNAADCPEIPGSNAPPPPAVCGEADGECRIATDSPTCGDYKVTEHGAQTEVYRSDEGDYGGHTTTTSDNMGISIFSEWGEGAVWVGGPAAGNNNEYFKFKIEFTSPVALNALSFKQDAGGRVWITDENENEITAQDCYGPNGGSPGADCLLNFGTSVGTIFFVHMTSSHSCGRGCWTWWKEPTLMCAAESDVTITTNTGNNDLVSRINNYVGLAPIHGPWGNDLRDVSMIFPLPIGATECMYSWRQWYVDSRDNERDWVTIDETEVWTEHVNMHNDARCRAGWTVDPSGSFPHPWNGANGPACYKDFTFRKECSGSTEIRWRTDIDQGLGDEGWAFSNVVVTGRFPTGIVYADVNYRPQDAYDTDVATYSFMVPEGTDSPSIRLQFQLGEAQIVRGLRMVIAGTSGEYDFLSVKTKDGTLNEIGGFSDVTDLRNGVDDEDLFPDEFPHNIAVRETEPNAQPTPTTTGGMSFDAVMANQIQLEFTVVNADPAPTWIDVQATLGQGYCQDWRYLPEGGYPGRLPTSSPMYNADHRTECMNRCLNAVGQNEIGNQAFYTRTSGQCACSQGACASLSNSGSYRSYHIAGSMSESITYMPLFEVEVIGECLGGRCADKTRNIGRAVEPRNCRAHEMITKMLSPPALFTNLGKGDVIARTCLNGPTSTAPYAGTPLDGVVTLSTGMQLWEVPRSGRFRIVACGARGGFHNSGQRKGGTGACMSGMFNLIGGEVIRILVGQKGDDRYDNGDWGAGGGGGTFVVKNDGWQDPSNILVIAGGGAAAPDNGGFDTTIMGGTIEEAGVTGSPCNQAAGNNGGGGQGQSACGGAGFSQNGLSGHCSTKPQAFTNGGNGADYHWDGGFGGGGAPYNGGGAGGGWSGGGHSADR